MNATATATAVRPATAKQVAFLTKLAAEREIDAVEAEHFAAGDHADLDSRAASRLIDNLLARPRKSAARTASRIIGNVANAVVTEVGIYTPDNGASFFKVYPAQADRSRLLAKKMILEDGENSTWEYAGMASRFVRPEHRLSLEDAKRFGVILGVCMICGRMLTDETSIANGIGPVCADKY